MAGEKLRRLALHGITIQCGTKSDLIAPFKTLTDSYTQFLSEKPSPVSIQWLGHPNPYHTKLHYRSIPCFNTLVDSVRFFITISIITLFSYAQHFYIAELYLNLTQRWGMPSFIILLSNSEFQNIAEHYPILVLCWRTPNNNTLLSYTLP